MYSIEAIKDKIKEKLELIVKRYEGAEFEASFLNIKDRVKSYLTVLLQEEVIEDYQVITHMDEGIIDIRLRFFSYDSRQWFIQLGVNTRTFTLPEHLFKIE